MESGVAASVNGFTACPPHKQLRPESGDYQDLIPPPQRRLAAIRKPPQFPGLMIFAS
jgi:hypothetical protein